MPATIAGSLRKCSDAGGNEPRDMWTTHVVSSTVTNCRPDFWKSRSVRPKQGRMRACSPVIRWPRLSLVEICTVSRHFARASDVYFVSGVAERKFPPSPTKTFTLP